MKTLPGSVMLNSEEETRRFAVKFSGMIGKGNRICISGNLGAGKTYFIKAVCENFGISNANSPTFAIINEYSGVYDVVHFDFYRLKDLKELYDIGVDDYFNDPDKIIFIEWADKFPEILPDKRIDLKFEYIGPTIRKLNMRVYE